MDASQVVFSVKALNNNPFLFSSFLLSVCSTKFLVSHAQSLEEG